METLTRLRGTFLGAGLVVAAALLPVVGNAAPFDARVIWTQGDRAYLVARDSAWVTAGSSLRFINKKEETASGVVLLIEDSRLVVAKITTGSLARVKHLDRIRVDAEPGSARVALRLGYPSSARIQPFFECRHMTLEPRGYRADTLSSRSYRLVRAVAAAGPDTLFVRLFDDAADEEIALERGELDAAVFWPGEASTHIRESMRWTGTPKPTRSSGAIGIRPKGQVSYSVELVLGRFPESEEKRLDRLNADLFRGDLVPIPYAGPDSLVKPAFSYEVDPTLPGRERILHVLSQGASHSAGWTLTFFDDPTVGRYDNDVEPTFWVFLIGCPVISRPELRPYLESIDLSAIVNLFDCETAGRKR